MNFMNFTMIMDFTVNMVYSVTMGRVFFLLVFRFLSLAVLLHSLWLFVRMDNSLNLLYNEKRFVLKMIIISIILSDMIFTGIFVHFDPVRTVNIYYFLCDFQNVC